MSQDTLLPMVIGHARVAAVSNPSPSFVRVELAGDVLSECGVDGPMYDIRIKLILPDDHGEVPQLGAGPDWYADWRALPEDRRGHMRTYTVRELVGSGPETRMVVDIVLHEGDHSGPGSRWAAGAQIGSTVGVIGPRRGAEWGGIEFLAPAPGEELLLVADETAVPAVAGILRDLDETARGTVFCEVPLESDVQHLEAPAGVEVRWLPRRGGDVGSAVVEAVRRHVGLDGGADLAHPDEVNPDIWVTPEYSTVDPLDPDAAPGPDLARWSEARIWIAGESRMVTTLRRALVREVGVPRERVCFMGYWREGVAMAS